MVDDTLEALTVAQWFSILDLKSGYHQVDMAEEQGLGEDEPLVIKGDGEKVCVPWTGQWLSPTAGLW